jgi:hypothetical protein
MEKSQNPIHTFLIDATASLLSSFRVGRNQYRATQFPFEGLNVKPSKVDSINNRSQDFNSGSRNFQVTLDPHFIHVLASLPKCQISKIIWNWPEVP